MTGPSIHPRRALTGRSASRGTVTAALALSAGLGLSGCGIMDASQAVTYEVNVVSGTIGDASARVEYISRETGLSQQETTGATESLATAPLRWETIGRADDGVSISVEGVPGVVLGCTILLDGVAAVEERSATAGEGVVCEATTPTLQD